MNSLLSHVSVVDLCVVIRVDSGSVLVVDIGRLVRINSLQMAVDILRLKSYLIVLGLSCLIMISWRKTWHLNCELVV